MLTHPGRDFERADYTKDSLQDALVMARALHDKVREEKLQHLIVTADGRYDYSNSNLNSMVNVVPQRFQNWLAQTWN